MKGDALVGWVLVKWSKEVDGVTTLYNEVLPAKWKRGKKLMYPLAGDVRGMSRKYADVAVKDTSPISRFHPHTYPLSAQPMSLQ